MTVDELATFLSKYPGKMGVISVTGQPFIHITNIGDTVLISPERPIGYCNKCGEYAYPERTYSENDYKGYCIECDENLFGFEISELEPERVEYYVGKGKNPGD